MGARRGARRALCVPSTTWLYAMTLSRVRPGTFSTMSALRAMRAGVRGVQPSQVPSRADVRAPARAVAAAYARGCERGSRAVHDAHVAAQQRVAAAVRVVVAQQRYAVHDQRLMRSPR